LNPPEHLGDAAYVGPTPPVSVVVLTLNEAVNIEACLRSCAWCDDVHVVDSGSRDPTVRLAEAAGATVHHHPFTSFGQQRNWIIDHVPSKHAWQFHLDADERFTAPLVREMAARLGETTTPAAAAFRVPSALVFRGRWLKHSGMYPVYQVRLLHRQRCRFVDVGHGQREQTDGAIETLHEPYLHLNFSHGVDAWHDKHRRYARHEARENFAQRRDMLDLPGLLSADATRRRRALKALSMRMPCRPALRFAYMYVLRLGFLDGRPGFEYCRMIAWYERQIVRELRKRRRETH